MKNNNYALTITTHLGGVCKNEQLIGILGAEPQWVKKGSGEVSKIEMYAGVAEKDQQYEVTHVQNNSSCDVLVNQLGIDLSGKLTRTSVHNVDIKEKVVCTW